MIIRYENGEKIITHPTGVISRYTKKDLQRRRAALQAQAERNEERLVKLDFEITQLEI